MRCSPFRILIPCIIVAALECLLLFSRRNPGSVFPSLLQEDSLLFQDFTVHFHPTAGAFFQTGLPVQGYYYSAFFAMLISPLGSISMESAVRVWGILQCLAMLILIVLPCRRFSSRKQWFFVLYALLTITSVPLLANFRWGQVSTLMTLMVLASLFSYEKGGSVPSALLLAFITAIKFYPALFLFMYICRNDRRTATLFVFFSAALLFLPAVVLTPGGLIQYEREAVGSVLWSPWIAEQTDSMYLPHLLHRLLPIPGTGTMMTLLSIGSLFIPLCILLALNRSRRRPGGIDPVMIVCCVFLCFPFILRSSWMHYFTFLPFCQVTALMRISEGVGEGRPCRLIWRVLTALSMLLSSVLFLEMCGGWQVYGRFGFLLVADLLVLAALLFGTSWQTMAAEAPGRNRTVRREE